MTTKACTGCGVVKPLDAFSWDRRRKDGRQSQCRECTRKRQNAWKKANPERYRALRRAEYERSYRPKPRPTPAERFWSKVEKDGPPPAPTTMAANAGRCWVWTGARTPFGHGMFRFGGRAVRAHRFCYELLVAPVPDGLELDHLCRNPACVNPAHLEPVVHAENMRRAQRTHCMRGHEFSPENTRISPSGNRICRACHRYREKERQASRR